MINVNKNLQKKEISVIANLLLYNIYIEFILLKLYLLHQVTYSNIITGLP